MSGWKTAETADLYDPVTGAWVGIKDFSGKEVMVPSWAQDASGNVTGLVGPSSISMPLGSTLNLDSNPESLSNRLFSYSDYFRVTFGQEFLWQWYKSWRTAPSQTPIIKLSGDSTTVGNNIATTNYQPATLLPILAKQLGFGITTAMAGVSGKNSAQWLSTYLPADLATTIPAVYIIRWGINDPGAGITISQTIANIRSGLALIRATAGWDNSAVAIVVMAPNTTSSDAVGSNEAWHEAVSYGLRQAARDYGAAFVDSYALVRTARNLVPNVANGWLDAAFVHPNEDHSLMLIQELANLLFPIGLVKMMGYPVDLTAGATFAQPGSVENAKSSIEGGRVFFQGYLNGSGATVTGGATVATIPIQHRPASSGYFADAYVWNGTGSTLAANWETIPVLVTAPSGSITTMKASTLTVSRIYFDKINYPRF